MHRAKTYCVSPPAPTSPPPPRHRLPASTPVSSPATPPHPPRSSFASPSLIHQRTKMQPFVKGSSPRRSASPHLVPRAAARHVRPPPAMPRPPRRRIPPLPAPSPPASVRPLRVDSSASPLPATSARLHRSPRRRSPRLVRLRHPRAASPAPRRCPPRAPRRAQPPTATANSCLPCLSA